MTESDSTPKKICSKCHFNLPLTEFRKQPECRDGHRPECRDCMKKYRRAYYLQHQERLRSYSSDYYKNNRGQVAEASKIRRSKNKHRITAYFQRWYAANGDKFRERQRAYHHTNRETIIRKRKIYQRENRKRLSETSKRYAQAHPEKIKLYKDKNRAKRKAAKGTCTTAQWLAKCEYHGWRCYLCGSQLDHKSLTIEHRIPLTKGGTEWPANLAPACLPCNLSKNNKTEREYRDHVKLISASKRRR